MDLKSNTHNACPPQRSSNSMAPVTTTRPALPPLDYARRAGLETRRVSAHLEPAPALPAPLHHGNGALDAPRGCAPPRESSPPPAKEAALSPRFPLQFRHLIRVWRGMPRRRTDLASRARRRPARVTGSGEGCGTAAPIWPPGEEPPNAGYRIRRGLPPPPLDFVSCARRRPTRAALTDPTSGGCTWADCIFYYLGVSM